MGSGGPVPNKPLTSQDVLDRLLYKEFSPAHSERFPTAVSSTNNNKASFQNVNLQDMAA